MKATSALGGKVGPDNIAVADRPRFLEFSRRPSPAFRIPATGQRQIGVRCAADG